MKTFLGLIAGLLLSLPPAAAEVQYLDWLEPSHSAYSLVREAAAQHGYQGWMRSRLQAKQRIPQASARELILVLLESPKVEAGLKQRLAGAFPSEVSQFEDRSPKNRVGLDKVEAKMEKLEDRLEMIKATMRKNVFDRGSYPQANFNSWVGYNYSFQEGLLGGMASAPYLGFNANFSGNLENGSWGWSLNWTADDNPGFGIGAGTNLSIGAFEVQMGGQRFVNFSTLVFSGAGIPYTSPFGTNPADRVSITQADPFSGLQITNGLYVRYRDSPGWWYPFTDTQLSLSLPEGYWEPWFDDKLQTAALRVDMEGVSVPYVLEDGLPYLTGVFTSTDDPIQAGLNEGLRTQTNAAWAIGLDTAIWGGGNLIVEFGQSSWYREADPAEPTSKDVNFFDSGYFVTFNKSIGPTSVGFDYSYIGPNFISGGRAGRFYSGNGQAGASLDTTVDEDRPGEDPDSIAYQTISREPGFMTNNSQRVAAKFDVVMGLASMGFTASVSEQLNPSGPWLQTSFVLNGRGYNGHQWFDNLGNTWVRIPNGQATPPGPALGWDPNHATRLNRKWYFSHPSNAPAYYNGQLYDGDPNAGQQDPDWIKLEDPIWQDNQLHILLSENGKGDSRLRPDSKKYLNAFRATFNFDIKALLDRIRPASLSVNYEIRDTAETISFPRFTPEHLLAQSYAEAFLTWGFTQNVEFIAKAGYESLASDSTLVPLFFVIRDYGLGLNFKLDSLLTGLGMEMRLTRFEFEDMYYGPRSYEGYYASVGTGVSF